MNRREWDVLHAIMEDSSYSQRELSRICGHSLGIVNRSMKQLREVGYLNELGQATEAAYETAKQHSPRNAVILAAGFGMRMVPINQETSKAFLEVKGEVLIERLIRQLHEAGITDITVVVGFLREQFDYLIDEFGVKLAVNPEFASKNNLHSLSLVRKQIHNTYVVPCDIWCRENPFRKTEFYSWYMVTDQMTEESNVRIGRNLDLVYTRTDPGNAMIGIAYLTGTICQTVQQRLQLYSRDREYDREFWEATLYEKSGLSISARLVSCKDSVEINTYEQLRELDRDSGHLQSEVLRTVANALHAEEGEISDIAVLKKGMTNRSFLFSCRGKKYIMRIPGEGTEQLINRHQEAAVYHAIDGLQLSDRIVLMDPENGYKISQYIPNVRTCNPEDPKDLTACMKRLRAFHEMDLQVDHEFDIFEQIEFYESLWGGIPSAYRDYAKTKQQVFSLRDFIQVNAAPKVLTHIDAVPDNFLICEEEKRTSIWLIDWEYAGMQDPHVDIAMFCIYSMYDREQVDALIDIYFPEGCSETVRTKIYCYISACGLLWSNWCEYKRQLGVEFGAYSLAQYRYAKDYFRLAAARI